MTVVPSTALEAIASDATVHGAQRHVVELGAPMLGVAPSIGG